MNSYTIHLDPVVRLTDEQFYQLCRNNPDLKFERNAQGALVIMPPMGAEGGKREADLTLEVALWNRQAKLGVVFTMEPTKSGPATLAIFEDTCGNLIQLYQA